jgi:hypothetical protein
VKGDKVKISGFNKSENFLPLHFGDVTMANMGPEEQRVSVGK